MRSPVIFVSLKGINAATYDKAFGFAVDLIQGVAESFRFFWDSEQLSGYDKSVYKKLLDSEMNEVVLCGSLKRLSGLLEKHYGRKVILLIEEV